VKSSNPDLASAMTDDLLGMQKLVEPFRARRNRAIAHTDLATKQKIDGQMAPGISRQMVEDVLAKLRQSMNRYDQAFFNNTTVYEMVSRLSDRTETSSRNSSNAPWRFATLRGSKNWAETFGSTVASATRSRRRNELSGRGALLHHSIRQRGGWLKSCRIRPARRRSSIRALRTLVEHLDQHGSSSFGPLGISEGFLGGQISC
jgi:hypothetical protein